MVHGCNTTRRVLRRCRGALCAALLAGGAASAAADAITEGLGAYQLGDYERAYELWRPLAEQGNVRARFQLGLLFAEGQGVARNPVKAAFWFREAAQAGYAPAQHRLALMYYQGAGVPQDLSQAVAWWRLAGRQGSPEALFNLGGLNHLGQGLPQDLDRAEQLYRAAARRGHEGARQALVKLQADREQLERLQQAQAEVRAQAERQARQVPAAVEPPQQSVQVHDADWVMAQPPEHFTVQVFAAVQPESVERFLQGFAGEYEVAVYSFQRKDDLWHSVLYGSFRNRAQAELAVRRLRASGQPVDAWIRQLANVQALEPQ
jgi:TPR repeat protein